MGKSDTTSRMNRLDLLAAQLKQDVHCTVQDLAARFGVSVRTITRDLAVLREQGVPVDADRGRGGGVRIDHDWGVGRVNLSYPEAVDLLISIAVAERMDSPLFLANLGAVRRQLVASFSPAKRKQVNAMKDRILIGTTASPFVQKGHLAAPQRVVRALHQTFLDQESLDIRYSREDGRLSDRVIEPHYLLLKYPVWYVIAIDHLRGAARTFRCDRIQRARRTGDRFALRPKGAFSAAVTADDLAILAAR